MCYWNGNNKEQTQETESRSDLKKISSQILGQQRLGIANFKVLFWDFLWGFFVCLGFWCFLLLIVNRSWIMV